MWLKALWISLIGAFLCLDSVAVGQFMISRPICSGPFIGLLLGDVRTGLLVGTFLELLWFSPIPVGAYVLPDIESSSIIATVVAADIVATRGAIGNLSAAGIAIIFSLPVAYVGQFGGILVRRINNVISQHTIETIDNPNSLFWWLGLGITVFFLRHFFTCFLGLIVSIPLARLIIENLSPGILKGLAMVPLWCLVLGLATMIKKVREKRIYCLLLIGFGTALILRGSLSQKGFNFVSVLIVCGICTYSWIFFYRMWALHK